MSERIPLLIDTDPGVDDALALLIAFSDPRHEVVGLSIAAGNVGLPHTVANALKLCEVAGVDVPVHPGCPVPLVCEAADAAYVHGKDGFGDTNYVPAKRPPDPEVAALSIVRLARKHEGRLLLVTIAPLTNIALALRLDPELPERIARLVVMGGAVNGRGNTSVSAEFNIGFDPEAAQIVFEAFPDFDLVDWEATLSHAIAHADIEKWLEADDPRARFYCDISRNTRAWSADRRGDRWPAADALAMAVALDPGHIQESAKRAVGVERTGALTRGATVVDWLQRGDRPARARIVQRYDQPHFEALVRRALGVRSEG
jgi:purine nucleosidase